MQSPGPRATRSVSRLAAAVAVALGTLTLAQPALAEPTPASTATSTPSPTASASDSPSATTPPATTPTLEPSPSSAAPTGTPTASGTATSGATPSATPSTTSAAPDRATSWLGVTADGGQPAEAGYAAGFLSRELAARGDRFTYPGGDYFDGGATIDAVLSLAGAGVDKGQADASMVYLAAHLGDYIGAFGETYAGPTAKALVGVVAHGDDPTTFGGVDLVARLQGLEQADGRFLDASQWGDYSNTFGQSLALIGLGRATGSVSPASVAFLKAQQCPDGGFRVDPDEACSSDADATGYAVQALAATAGPSDAAVTKGLDYLAGRQDATGGVLGSAPQTVRNANTTALAAQAFAAGGRSAEQADAEEFLVGLQYGCAASPALRGGIAYSADALEEQLALGAKAEVTDQDLRSTSQAGLGLSGHTLSDVAWAGDSAAAPTVPCADPEPSATTDPSSSPTSSGGADDSTSTTTPVAGGESGSDGPLAQTGATVLPVVGTGLALLALGSFVLVLARRRGAHA